MTYHEGELTVQARAGFRDRAAKMANGIRDYVVPAAAQFLAERSFAVIAAADDAGRMWASPLTGPPGFIKIVEPRVVRVKALVPVGDPLGEVLTKHANVGMIAVDFATRRRFRINGRAERRGDALVIGVVQSYGNCPQYIQIRERAAGTVPIPQAPRESTRLAQRQSEVIAGADTFFIATSHPSGGADASHRGGLPGFVAVEADDRLAFPDYPGNTMFNTLGNLEVNPRAGLLFIDFESGTTVQMSGTARINWDLASAAKFPGAERVIEFAVERVVEIAGALPIRWKLIAYSPSFTRGSRR
jgi:uncharacterized protein